MRMEFYNNDIKEFSIAIKSLKHDRKYILTQFVNHPEYTHAIYDSRVYTASSIYARFFSIKPKQAIAEAEGVPLQ